MTQNGRREGETVRKRRHLPPETKFQIFLEASRGDVPVAEVLRKWGIHSSDLNLHGLAAKVLLATLSPMNRPVC